MELFTGHGTPTPGFVPCHLCGRAGPLQCSRCKAVQYCSQECQRAHWKFHKPSCRSVAAGELTPAASSKPLVKNEPVRVTNGARQIWKLCQAAYDTMYHDMPPRGTKERSHEEFEAALEKLLAVNPTADVNVLVEEKTPLCLAVGAGSFKMVKMLLHRGANPMLADISQGKALPIHVCAHTRCPNQLDILKLLVDAGGYSDTIDCCGVTVMECLQQQMRGNEDLFRQWLIRRGHNGPLPHGESPIVETPAEAAARGFNMTIELPNLENIRVGELFSKESEVGGTRTSVHCEFPVRC